MGTVNNNSTVKKKGLVLPPLSSMLAVQSLSAEVTQDLAMQAELQVKGSSIFHFSIHRIGHHSFLERPSHADRFLSRLGVSAWAAMR